MHQSSRDLHFAWLSFTDSGQILNQTPPGRDSQPYPSKCLVLAFDQQSIGLLVNFEITEGNWDHFCKVSGYATRKNLP